MKSWLNNRPFVVTGIVLIIVAVWFYAVHVQESNTISKDEQTISTLNTQLSAANSQNTALQTQLSTAKSQATTLQSQVDSLQTTLNDSNAILKLSKSTVEATQLTINQGSREVTTLASFTADYAGFVEINTTSTTPTGYVVVTNSAKGYPFNSYEYAVGTSDNIIVPVLPGATAVNFSNRTLGVGATATATVIYHY